MANIAELEKVLTFIKDHPTQHDQTSWLMPSNYPVLTPQPLEVFHPQFNECGTTACFAGHTALLNGCSYQQVWEMGCHVADFAARVLDLDDDQTHALFYRAKTLAEVEVVVKAIANGQDPLIAVEEYRDEQELGIGPHEGGF